MHVLQLSRKGLEKVSIQQKCVQTIKENIKNYEDKYTFLYFHYQKQANKDKVNKDYITRLCPTLQNA